jgi:hypothetical protein
MAFLIPDNLKSRSDVPAMIRRTVSAFQVGLDDSCVVWYEPLYDRSGEKPHLVVLIPDRGIAVLEVVDARTSKFMGIFKGKPQFSRDGAEIPNPVDRAHKLAALLDQRVQAEPRVSRLSLSVAAGVCFTNLTSAEAKENRISTVIPDAFCIYKEEIDAAIAGVGEAALMRAFTRLLGPPLEEQITPEIDKALRGLIQPDTVIGTVFGGTPDQLQIFQPPCADVETLRVMDRQQEALAKSLGDGHRVIRGVAGSGKTLVLVFRAKLLAENFPNKKFLLTCYTKTLASQLKTLLSRYPNVDVINLHALMYEIIRSARLSYDFKENDFSKMVATAFTALAKGVGPRYDAVLVDEAQDLETDELQFVTKLLKDGADDLVIVADAAQNIFKRKFSWKQAGVKAQGRTRLLRINYRNTKQILEFASKFLLNSKTLTTDDAPDFDDENVVIPPQSAQRSGASPILEIVEDVETEIKRTIELTQDWLSKLSPSDKIAVLYPGTDRKDRGYLLNRDLRAAGVDVYWACDRHKRGSKAGLATATERVVLSTIHSCKGLEYPHVIICGIWKDKHEIEENRKLAYVGMTRATETLHIISRGGHELFDDLQTANCDASSVKIDEQNFYPTSPKQPLGLRF